MVFPAACFSNDKVLKVIKLVNYYSLIFVSIMAFLAGCGGGVARLDRAELENGTVERALKLVQAGDPGAALKLFEKALKRDPDLARVHLEIGILFHEVEKNYVGAIYHYRKYLELRPESQKREMIENRMRIARQMLAAGVVGTENVTALRVEELERANFDLRAKIRNLDAQLVEARRVSMAEMSHRQASNAVAAAEDEDVDSDTEGGIRHYTVQRGDSLSSIALKIYRDVNKWDQIYEANRKELESSNDLKAGQVLIIP